MFKQKSATNETKGRFICTEIRETDGGIGQPLAGASFLFDDGDTRAVWHSFENPAGTWSFAGRVPLGLNAVYDTLQDTIDAVQRLNERFA